MFNTAARTISLRCFKALFILAIFVLMGLVGSLRSGFSSSPTKAVSEASVTITLLTQFPASGQVVAGATVTYTFTVVANSNLSSSTVIQFNPDDNLINTTGQVLTGSACTQFAGSDGDPNDLICLPGSLGVGGTFVITISGTASGTGVISTFQTGDSDNCADDDAGNVIIVGPVPCVGPASGAPEILVRDGASDTTPADLIDVNNGADLTVIDLALTLNCDGGPVFEGNTATCTATISFNGAAGVDPLPVNLVMNLASGAVAGEPIFVSCGVTSGAVTSFGAPAIGANSGSCIGVDFTLATAATVTLMVRFEPVDTANGGTFTATALSTGTNPTGNQTVSFTVQEVGLLNLTFGRALGNTFDVCTGTAASDLANVSARGAALGAGDAASNTLAVVGPAPGLLIALGVTECGPNQEGVRFTPTAAGTYTITSSYFPANFVTGTNVITIEVIQTSVLLTKTPTKSSVTGTPIEAFAWILQIRNTGPATITNLHVVDASVTGGDARIAPAPAIQTNLGGVIGCNLVGTLLDCTIPSMVPGQSISMVIGMTTVVGAANGSIANSFTVSSPDLFGTPSGSTNVVIANPPPPAPLQLAAGANGVLWTGAAVEVAGLATALPTEVTAAFRWNNNAQRFDFWFRGFPFGMQSMDGGIRPGNFVFLQAGQAASVTPPAPTMFTLAQAPAEASLNAGTTGAIWSGSSAQGSSGIGQAIPASVTGVFGWDNGGQRFSFWFRGFPASMSTLTDLEHGGYYFFAAQSGGGVLRMAQ